VTHDSSTPPTLRRIFQKTRLKAGPFSAKGAVPALQNEVKYTYDQEK
jgi:hypothetical protein